MNHCGILVTWENDFVHPGISLEKLGHSQSVPEVLFHSQVQRLQSTITHVAVKRGWDGPQS